MITFSNNPVEDYERYSKKQEKELENLPRCADCDEPIQSETAFYINDEWICEECIDSYRREVVADGYNDSFEES